MQRSKRNGRKLRGGSIGVLAGMGLGAYALGAVGGSMATYLYQKRRQEKEVGTCAWTQAAITNLTLERDALKRQVEDLNSQLAAATQKLESLKRETDAQLQTIGVKIPQTVEELKAAQSKVAELTNNKADAMLQVTNANDEIKRLKDELEAYKKTMADQLAAAQAEVVKLNARIAELEGLANNADGKSDALTAEIEKLKLDHAAELATALSTSKTQLDELRQQLDQLKASSASELDQLKASLASEREALETSYKEKLAAAENLSKQGEATLNSLRAEIDQLKQKITGMEGTDAEQKKLLEEKERLFGLLTADNANLKSLIADKDKIIAELQTQIAALTGELAASKNEKTGLQSQLSGELGELKQAKDAVEKALLSNSSELKSKLLELKASLAEVEELQKQLQLQKDNQSNLEKQLRDCKLQLSATLVAAGTKGLSDAAAPEDTVSMMAQRDSIAAGMAKLQSNLPPATPKTDDEQIDDMMAKLGGGKRRIKAYF
jgi:colicin import membrane protein